MPSRTDSNREERYHGAMGRDRMPRIHHRHRGEILLALVFLSGCAPTLRTIQHEADARIIRTAEGNESMVFLAETAAGYLTVDLGWTGAEEALDRELSRLGAVPEDVTHVLLTHAHRDHVVAWPLVRHATFHMAEAEVPLFTGRARPGGWAPALAAAVIPPHRPEPGEVRIEAFSSDTTLVIGRDTVRAFLVPGHTAGSTAYLFRRILFVGDAGVAEIFGGGLRPAVGSLSDDREQAIRSLASLWERVASYEVHWVCTAHSECMRYREVAPGSQGGGRRRHFVGSMSAFTTRPASTSAMAASASARP